MQLSLLAPTPAEPDVVAAISHRGPVSASAVALMLIAVPPRRLFVTEIRPVNASEPPQTWSTCIESYLTLPTPPTYWLSASGDVYAVPNGGPRIARFIRGGPTSLRAELAALYYRHTGQVAFSGALPDSTGRRLGTPSSSRGSARWRTRY